MLSPYLVLGGFILILALLGRVERFERPAYYLSFISLSLFLIFRYGQGADWLSYNYIFSAAPNSIDLDSLFYTDVYHSEFGWKLINNIIKALGFDFVFLTVLVSIIEMGLLAKFINRYSSNRAFSLLLAYHTVYLTYFFSALRQGIVIALFLGIMINWLVEKKIVRYLIVTVLAASIHSAALVFFIPIFVRHISLRSLGIVICGSAIIGITVMPIMMPYLRDLTNVSYSESISWLAIAYRVAMASLIFLLYSSSYKKNVYGQEFDILLKVYCAGLSVYLLCMSNESVASRFAIQLLALDIAIVPTLIKFADKKNAFAIMIIVVMLVTVMTFKNLDSYVQQGSYYSFVNLFNYPYISIFDQSAIYEYCNNRYLVYL